MLPPPSRALDLALRRLTTQRVARENARSAWLDLARGRRERREVQEFLEAHVGERAAGHLYSVVVPGQRDAWPEG